MAQAVRSQILHVFDAAVGPATFCEVQVSKRLIADLKPYASRKTPFFTFFIISLLTFSRYQKKALAMMVEKESGEIENSKFPCLWVAEALSGGQKRLVSILHR